MEIKKDSSVGIIPVHSGPDGTQLFCLVHHTVGHWAFPKGHEDAGESREAAARRELYEETGVLTCKIDGAHTFSEKYSFEKDNVHYDKEVTYFVGFVDSLEHTAPPAFKHEISESRWLSYYEAKDLLTFPEAKKLLNEVQAYLQARA